MTGMELIEWTFSRYTPADRAAAILGDLLETAQTRGRVWFYVAATRVLLRMAWRLPVAWVCAYAVGSLLFTSMTTRDPLWNDINPKSWFPYPDSSPMETVEGIIFGVAMVLWFVAPYSLLRFGVRDRFAKLAVLLCGITTVAMLVIWLNGVVLACAAMVVAILVTGLCLRDWRRPTIALIVATFAALSGTAIVIVTQEMLVDRHPGWSYNLHWVLVRLALAMGFTVLTAMCSLMHSMMRLPVKKFAGVMVAVALLSTAAFAWGTNTNEAFAVADVHASPFRREPESRHTISGDRYHLRDATMLDMIAVANDLDRKNIVGGPNWLEWDRFDVIAKIPPGTQLATVREMLGSLLKDRFKLKTHEDTRPMPAFILTVIPGKLKMKPGNPRAPNTCEPVPQNTPAGAVPYVVVSCKNQSPELLAADMHQMAGGYVTSPAVDKTGLKGVWDFEIKWSAKNQLAKSGADGISFFDAVEKQLGLQLTPGTAPLPVLVVDSVIETPTPNVADISKQLPPLPLPEFEVSVIKPSKPDTKMDGDLSGGQAKFQGVTLDLLIRAAWDLPDNGPMLQGAPKWLTEDKFDILAKAPREAGAPELDQDELRLMLQKLLAERFMLKTHLEDQTMDAYNLVAANPRLKKANSATRTSCRQGPGADGKDPRVANPILNRLLTCQGISMAQFAGQVQTLAAGYIKTPVLDTTGIDGAYDFTLSYSGAGKLRNAGGPSDTSSGPEASDPSGGISFFDAMQRQLGLKLEKVKRPVPVLVIDHVEQKPTEN